MLWTANNKITDPRFAYSVALVQFALDDFARATARGLRY